MLPEENQPGELNAEEQDSLKVGEALEDQQEERLAGKYKNAQELEAAYLELQKKLGEPQTENNEAAPEEEEETSNTSLLEDLWDQASGDGVNEETMKKLSETDPSELAKAYLDYRSQVEASASRMTEQQATDLRNAVGGDEKYNQMLSWASDNLTEQEIQLYDGIMEKGDPAAAYFAVQALSYRYQDGNGVEGDLVQGKAAPSAKGFRSQAELVQAMSDPRYDRDPAYRLDVQRKLEISNVQF